MFSEIVMCLTGMGHRTYKDDDVDIERVVGRVNVENWMVGHIPDSVWNDEIVL